MAYDETNLDLRLDVLDGVRRLHLEGDGLAGEGLHEDLHTATEPQDEVEGALLLDIVVGEGSSVFELFSSEDKPLLIWRNPLLILKQQVCMKSETTFNHQGYLFCTFAEFFNSAKNSQDCEKWKKTTKFTRILSRF